MIYRQYDLTLWDCPKSVNAGGGGSRSHWGVAHREKMRWQDEFGMQFLIAGVEKGMQFCVVTVTLLWRDKRRRDSTNYFQPVVKPLLDALVGGGFIKDDTDEWVKVNPIKMEAGHTGDGWPSSRIKCATHIELDGAYL